MPTEIDVQWMVQKGYSLESHLIAEGMSFDAFYIINRADSKTGKSIRKKIISKFMKDLRSDFSEDYKGVDISKIKYGVYCISIGTGFEIDYTEKTSRVLYIGSGAVYDRIKQHLSGKLFDFVRALRTIPLRFYICDLSDVENGRNAQRDLEYALLRRFCEEIDDNFPLLNKRNAPKKSTGCNFSKKWHFPIQKDRGKNTTQWLIKPYDMGMWKGSLS